MGISRFLHFVLIVSLLIVEVYCQNCTGYDIWCVDLMNRDCIPVCENACENGRCLGLNTCTCNQGYFKVNGRCTPQCKNCDNGHCIGPDKCICKDNFVKNVDGLCVPRCEDYCINRLCNTMQKSHGNCSSPNNCICDEGYMQSKDNCIPICEPPCVNGKCIEPGKCLCSDGFHYSDQSHICAPSCNPPCMNGDCVGVNQCSCLNGYKKFNNSFCTPSCDPKYILVENGECIAPNILRCKPEYELEHSPDSILTCASRCNSSCENARCTVNGTCQCNHGYEKIPRSFHECKPICVPPCQNGHCIKPNTCECALGFAKFNDSTSCRPVCSYCTGDLCIKPEECRHEMIATVLNFCRENNWSIVVPIIGIITTLAIIVLASKRFFKEDIASSFVSYDDTDDIILPQVIARAERNAIESEIYEDMSYALYENC